MRLRKTGNEGKIFALVDMLRKYIQHHGDVIAVTMVT